MRIPQSFEEHVPQCSSMFLEERGTMRNHLRNLSRNFIKDWKIGKLRTTISIVFKHWKVIISVQNLLWHNKYVVICHKALLLGHSSSGSSMFLKRFLMVPRSSKTLRNLRNSSNFEEPSLFWGIQNISSRNSSWGIPRGMFLVPRSSFPPLDTIEIKPGIWWFEKLTY